MSQKQPSNDFEFIENYDKDKVKQALDLAQVTALVDSLGGQPQVFEDYLISKTICHNTMEEVENASHKLYYYDNTKLFHCYTGCDNSSFDIFELVCKVKNINGQFKTYTKGGKIVTRKWELFDAISFVLNFFNFNSEGFKSDTYRKSPDWEYLNKCQKNSLVYENKIVEMNFFNEDILRYLPHPHILPWERENISYEVCLDRGIAYDPVNYGIIIPHYDIDNKLVGIRTRTLIKEDEIYGKYRPAILGGQMYNHPLGFNLYNLNKSKENIKNMKIAIVYEGEKSCLLHASYFGTGSDISVAICGSSFSSYQFNLLKNLGVNEIVIGFDKQFKELGDAEWKVWTKKLTEINNKYGADVKISFLFDKWNLLGYKDSPIDKGAEVFQKLFKERISI